MLTQELADDFEKEYESEEREPLVLRDGGMGGKGHYRSAVMGSLADMDVKIRKLTPTDDRHAAIFWPVTSKKQHERACFPRFQEGTVCRVMARSRKIPPGPALYAQGP